MLIRHDGNNQAIFDKHYSLRCPHCQRESNITAISFPAYEHLARFKPPVVGIVYKCDSCLQPIFASFVIRRYDLGNYRIEYDEDSPTFLNRALEPFDYELLPDSVRTAFHEAVECHAIGAYNGFAALCRRTVQAVAADLGAVGKDKVQRQVQDLEDMGAVDPESIAIVRRIIIDGHDGAHPHLPALSQDRAEVMMELMKDVLYQLYVRKAKLERAAELRQRQIEAAKRG